MNAYEEKVEARKEYYEKKAAAARAESRARWDESSKMASRIPFGQPILVGHHSERADRAAPRRRPRATPAVVNSLRLVPSVRRKASCAFRKKR